MFPGIGNATRRAARAMADRVDRAYTIHGPSFRDLALSSTGNAAGDAALAVALADTLFFSVPSVEARTNVALYLAIALAPFAVIGPALGALFERYPWSYRYGLFASAVGRIGLVAALWTLGLQSLWIYPLALGILVLSRSFLIARAALLPVALPRPDVLISAIARVSRLSIVGGAGGALVGALLVTWLEAAGGMGVSVVGYAIAAVWGARIPAPQVNPAPFSQQKAGVLTPRQVRLARAATAVVRFLNGLLLLLMAFAFRGGDTPLLDLGLILAAASVGWGLATVLAPALQRRLREEPTVVAALALEAAAAFIAAQVFGLTAAIALAATAGFAWGIAKLAFDGLLLQSVAGRDRGRAFTRAETIFQLAWVVGALLPTGLSIPTELGLAVAGSAALLAQVVIVSGLLRSVRGTV